MGMHKQRATSLKLQYFAVIVDNDFCVFQKSYLRLKLNESYKKSHLRIFNHVCWIDLPLVFDLREFCLQSYIWVALVSLSTWQTSFLLLTTNVNRICTNNTVLKSVFLEFMFYWPSGPIGYFFLKSIWVALQKMYLCFPYL